MKQEHRFNPSIKENMVSKNSEFVKTTHPKDKAFLIVSHDHGADERTRQLNTYLNARARGPP